MNKRFPIFIVAILFFLPHQVFAKNFTVIGTVRDTQSGEALPKVNVQEEFSGFGTVSDSQGRYRLNISLQDSLPRLSFSHISYEKETVILNVRDTVLNIWLVRTGFALADHYYLRKGPCF
ncbi:MAG TPA: hypothetical protein ENN84_09975 [Candidatus Marinimicrobia bacterium]|nr:hypothetical protein [Candidatus Neomarinimicrobiota bacterium]